MAYSINMAAAAYRHLEAAEILAETKRRDVAGYIFGIAAECAIKAMLPTIGVMPKNSTRTPGDPFFAHFPELRTLLRDTLSGRKGIPLNRLIQDDGFFNGWDTNMRYSDGKSIMAKWVDAWAKQARETVGLIGT